MSEYWDFINRRRLSRRGVLKGGAGLLGLAVAGCTTTPETAPAATSTPAAASQPTAAATPSPKRGGTLAYYTTANEFAHLDPHQLGFIPFFDNMHSFSRVMRNKVDGDPSALVPTGDLAESWEQADDTTYIFKLRRGVKFHNVPPANGRELTAQDVVWSFNRQVGEKLNASYLGSLQKFEATDNYTLRVTIPKPDADFLATFADFHNVILNKESVEAKGDLKEGPLIGTGAFVFEKWDKNSVMTFNRNSDYFDKSLPYVDRIEIYRLADPAALEAAFRAKKLSIVSPGNLTKDAVDRIKAQFPEVILTPVPQAESGVELSLNTQAAPTSDLRVRQAINKAIDRTAIRDTIFFGEGWMTSDLRLPGADYNLPQDELRKNHWTRDLEGAKKLLADAGFPNGFDLEIETLNLASGFTQTAELLVAQLKDAGIRATIHLHEAAVDRDLKFNLKYKNLHLSGVSPEPSLNSELYGRYYTKGPRNSTGYSDPELDAMIDKQAVMSRDPEGRKKIVLDIQRRIMDRSGMIMPNPLAGRAVLWPNVKNLWLGLNAEPYRMTTVWLAS
jgi:peptide/nickel transport system substrate-binding protein